MVRVLAIRFFEELMFYYTLRSEYWFLGSLKSISTYCRQFSKALENENVFVSSFSHPVVPNL